MISVCQPYSTDSVLSVFRDDPFSFLQPSSSLHTSFVDLAKTYIDPLAANVASTQAARREVNRSRKKKHEADLKEVIHWLRLHNVHTDGLDIAQIWQQVKIVLDATGEEIERLLARELYTHEKTGRSYMDGIDRRSTETTQDTRDAEKDFLEKSRRIGLDRDNRDLDCTSNDNPAQEEYGEVRTDSDESSLDIGGATTPSEVFEEQHVQAIDTVNLVQDKFGLNDGFFSIDDFNKRSQFLEQADMRGEHDGAASDEEDIDWTVNPTIIDFLPISSERVRTSEPVTPSDGHDLHGEGEVGPTFEDVSDEGGIDMEYHSTEAERKDFGSLSNTNDVMYADFFAPPARMSSTKNSTKTLAEGCATYSSAASELEGNTKDGDYERTVSAVHRDLFEEDDSDNPGSTDDESTTPKFLSSHERHQLALRAEIRALEIANVSSKPWSLAGEALGPARPLNSLLQEDLDFERAGKPIPVVMDAVHEDIEALIKGRVLARDFNEVIRRKPTDLVTGHLTKRRRSIDLDLSNAKADKGLADEYAGDHLRRTDPGFTEQRSEMLKVKHADIETHWAVLSTQLDTLCNWHYKPRPRRSGIEVKVDVPRVVLEDARPNTAGEGVEEHVLAPQELYKPGDEGKRRDEVLTKGGSAIDKGEESREQKARRRRREKKRVRMEMGNMTSSIRGTHPKQRTKGDKSETVNVVGQLKRGGVKVINRKGEVKDAEGKTLHAEAVKFGGGSLRL